MKSINHPRAKDTNPYKGLQFYEEKDKDNFYGRNEDTEEMYQLVLFHFLTVVYGKAGIGKTSLLNAGLFPRLKNEGFLPIRVRFNYADEAPSLLEQIQYAILTEIKESRIDPKTKNTDEPAEPINTNETLLEYFNRVRHVDKSGHHLFTPVLVFDQFEELFTLGKNRKDKDALIDALKELIESQTPDPGGSPTSEEMLHLRIIISLREDYLPHFIQLKFKMKSIQKPMFRVTHLNGAQARDVIRMPGGLQDDELINQILHRFYPEPLKHLETVPDDKLEIEPAFLSLLCHRLFEKKEQEIKSLSPKEQDKILQEFYNSTINQFPHKVGKFIEDNLLTKGGFRTLYPMAQNHPLIDSISQLIEQRILRKEYWGGTEYIEIIHDVLTPIIKEKREQKAKTKKNIIIGFLTAIIIFLFALTWYAFYQENRANEQYKNVLELKVISDALMEFPTDNTRAVRIAEKAFKMGHPKPQESTYQVLSTIGYSSLQRPFYIAALSHKSPLYSAAFSPDDKYILTACDDNTAKVWTPDQKLFLELNKHKARVLSACFSPDGSKILTASWDKTTILWDLRGKPPIVLNKHKSAVTSAVFSADGSRILTASRDNTAKLWDLQGNLQVDLNKHTGAVASAVFSPDGSKILTASWDKTARLWNLKGEELLSTPIKHNDALSSAVFSPNGRMVLTASWDKTAKLSDLQGSVITEFKGHKQAVVSAVFSPDQTLVLTASRDNTAKLWNLVEQSTIDLKHNDILTHANFSHNGRKIVTTSRDGIVKLWDTEGKLLLELNKFNGNVSSAHFSQNGKCLLTACDDGTAAVWALDTNLLVNLNKHEGAVNSAVFSPDGTKVLTASNDHTAKIWSLDGKLLAYLIKLQSEISFAIFSPDGEKILTISKETAKIWDLQGNLLCDFQQHTDVITSAVFSNDSQKILTASEDGTAKVWDLQGNILVNLKKHRGAVVLSAVFSPDDRLVLTASIDKTAKVSNVEGKTLAKLTQHTDVVNSAVFSPDGKLIVTASRDGTAKLWGIEGKLLANLDKHKGNVLSAGFSPDNKYILTASEDGTAKLWDPEGKIRADLDLHKSAVTSALFSPDGSRIITTSNDKTVKVWDIEGNLLANLDQHRDVINSARFSPNGNRIVTASRDGTAKIYLTPETIMKWLKTAKIPLLPQKN